MPLYVEVNGRLVEVPQDVEASGAAAIAAYLKKHQGGKPKADAPDEPKET